MLLITFTAGYVFSVFKKFRFVRIAYLLVLFTLMIPRYSMIIKPSKNGALFRVKRYLDSGDVANYLFSGWGIPYEKLHRQDTYIYY